MNKIRKNDRVVVMTGKDKGRQSTVLQIFANGKALVQGVNIVKKHQKPNPNLGIQGGVIEKEMPIQISNLMVLNPSTNKGERVGFKILDDGKKVRVFKSNGERVDA